MGIDISQLSPTAQVQIARKLAEQERQKAEKRTATRTGPTESRQGKYHNMPAKRAVDGGKSIKFDSQKEARYFDELMIRLRAGSIRDLRLQPQFTLQEAYTLPSGNRVRAIRYQADFSYYDCDLDEDVVVDVKGGKATQTRVYAIKKKMMLDKFGIEIQEV